MREKILILDAESTVRSVVVKILSRAGYEMSEASSLGSALEQVSASPVNLILTNVYLPGVTGHDCMKALKATAPAIPVLMVSGLPDSDVIDSWKDEPGWDIFPKPFAPETLVRKVEELLRTSKHIVASGS